MAERPLSDMLLYANLVGRYDGTAATRTEQVAYIKSLRPHHTYTRTVRRIGCNFWLLATRVWSKNSDDLPNTYRS